MSPRDIEITPSVTVHALLKAYPHVEDVRIDMAPPFKTLRNPILRRSVARVATLKQVAAVGRVPLDDLIGQLRAAVGQSASKHYYDDQDYFGEQPDWFAPEKIVLSVDEAEQNKDSMTLVTILREATNVKKGEIIELVTTFLPAPGIDILKSKGYSVWTHRESDDLIKSYFLKNTD